MSDKPSESSEDDTPRRQRRNRRVVRRGTETSVVAGVSADEEPDPWGDSTSATEPDYVRERPPHWRD